ncbi:hypothetical protein DH2020_016741 [Rehmannia glutinosa]|uniref:Nudix hydrolase domain-containing protein n=1 Tax=Rehmannia glutinosa TaxID=99300 RepID=A0ABR0WQK3_REHGL
MLKARQILRSSSSFRCVSLSRILKKPHGNLFSISGNHMKASDSSTTHSLGFQFRNTCGFRAFKMLHIRSDSTTPEASSSPSTAIPPTKYIQGGAGKINFCQRCGGPIKYALPDGEEKTRAICTHCAKITYENPKMVVGCLIEHQNKILLCKRKIHPSYGLWTLPAGYQENGESAAEGAIRETKEEANAEVEVVSQFAQLDIPLIGHAYTIFLAKLKSPDFSPGPESLECQLFPLEDIPLDSLAFSSMLVTLKLYIEDRKVGSPKFHYATINKRPGTGPSDIHAHTIGHHLIT